MKRIAKGNKKDGHQPATVLIMLEIKHEYENKTNSTNINKSFD